MATLIQIRRDTEANWTSNDPVLASGELALSTDEYKIKVGDGASAWSNLSYINALPAEITAEISAAIDSVIDAAPGTLDTLNELAAAINDDASFYTTITNSISSSIDALDTDDIEEGVANLYFTDQRALDATALAYDPAGSASTAQTAAENYAVAQDAIVTTNLQNYADQAESDAVTTSNAYTDTREAAITTAYQTYADTAESDAVTTANAYTDAREAAITTAYQSYSDTSEADAITTAAADATSKANTAETNANSYTDGQIATVNNTIGALNTDDIAEGTSLYFTDERAQDAINAAIASGTHSNITITYDDVNNTLSFAAEDGVADSTTDDLTEGVTNLYFTDARALSATSAAYDPAGSAATAESNANSYTDGEISTLDTSLKAYADQAEADAISAAATDATTKANTAESNANIYTDNLIGDVTVDGTGGNTITDRIASAVSGLVDSAPGTLDTLNELAAALGDDPNFATTIATEIGTKVSKAGDSMTGDLTLAQDPTLSLHAATKQYVDQAEADAVSTAAADATSKADAALASAQTYADTAEADAVTTANAYTDTRETAITTAYQSYADTAESDAVTTANAYTDTRETAITAAYQSYADTAEADAVSTAAADATTKANTAESNANTYTDTTVGALDTDDITEGSLNLYFTNARAISAVSENIAISNLSDVSSTAPNDGELLMYSSSSSSWSPVAVLDGGTP